MSKQEQNIVEYLVCCIGAFAERFALSNAMAYRYLTDHAGLAFLRENYDIEHTFSIEDAVADLAVICQRNGGSLK